MTHAYKRAGTAQHVVTTEDALKHWDNRRKGDSTEGIPPHNIGQLTSRLDALMRALAWMEVDGLDVTTAEVLDVGAAQGYGLRPFLLSGFSLQQLHGIDLFTDRVETGKRRTPGLDLIAGDATAMPYPAGTFDIVCEQFCFCHVPDDEAKRKMALEMMRVSRRFILIHDWRAGSTRKKLYGVSQARIREWFPGWKVGARFRSQLWPPIGRPLSRHAGLLYDAARIVNPLVGSWMTVLHR
jgi:hypothetical protein